MAIWSIEHLLRAEDNLTKVFNDEFSAALSRASFQAYMAERTGLGMSEKLEWLASTLTIDELPNGQMVYADLTSIGHEIKHTDFGKGFKVSRNEFRFDKFEKAKEAAAQLGSLAAYHPQGIAEKLLKEGHSKKCYDGQNFFAAAHPVNGKNNKNGTFSNYNASGVALTDVNFAARVAAVESRVMPNGISRNIQVTHLLVPPALRKTAFEITKAKFLGQATGGTNDNVLSNYGVEPVVVPGLAASAGGSDTTWYLIGSHGGEMGKPLIYSRAIDFGLNSYDGTTQAELNRMNEVEWQIRGFLAGAYGHPYLADKNAA